MTIIMPDYIELNIKDSDQSGYDAVGALIWNYYGYNPMDDLVIRIGISYNGKDYDIQNELVLTENGSFEFLNDWWEGQKFIRVYGIQSVLTFDISGGLYAN